MLEVSSASRVVFPEVGRTKGDVVAYYLQLGPRIMAHVGGRPLSLRRYPRGLAGPGFFQKNVPPHYPPAIGRVAVPRSAEATRRHARKGGGGAVADVTIYPVVGEAEQLAYLANQGAIELHVPTALADDLDRPDRLVLDLDPPVGAVELVRRAAYRTRDELAGFGLASAAVATGSKGYHVVAPIRRTVPGGALATAMQQLAVLLAAAEPELFTTAFRIARRGERVFLDWLRNEPGASYVAPYSLRATARATVATPLGWDEVATTAPDGFTIDDAARLVEREDPLAALATRPGDAVPFVAAIDLAFERSGLVLEPFDRFRS
jgi:bifunctional non-homologous end joining protein LigD